MAHEPNGGCVCEGYDEAFQYAKDLTLDMLRQGFANVPVLITRIVTGAMPNGIERKPHEKKR